jgi:hypothetical protein
MRFEFIKIFKVTIFHAIRIHPNFKGNISCDSNHSIQQNLKGLFHATRIQQNDWIRIQSTSYKIMLTDDDIQIYIKKNQHMVPLEISLMPTYFTYKIVRQVHNGIN